MKNLTQLFKWTLTCFFLLITLQLSAQNSVKGNVKDANNDPVIGANVVIKGAAEGAITDFDGNFSFKTAQAPPFKLKVSSVGYESKTVQVADLTGPIHIVLKIGTRLDEIIVSASRRREKVQEAPAAVSVLSAKKLEAYATSNPVQALQNLTGVDIATYGVGDQQINLRGKSTVFQSETLVIVDYRNVSMPSLGTNRAGQNPVDAIDLERVEVIKGPGSALYGPGVESGVVHFITKSPFKKQGLTLALGGGNQKQLNTAFRYAEVSKSEKVGFKLTGFYRSAENFKIDDEIGLARLEGYGSTITSFVTGETIDAKIPDYDTKSYGFTGTLEYKMSDKTTITGVTGFSSVEGIFRSAQGEGYSKAPRPFAQVRVQSGGLFAQAFWSRQNSGDNSWLYASGSTTYSDVSQYEGQVQYNWDVLNDKMNLTIGSDYKFNTIDTKGSVYGVNEDNDDYSVYGAYLQGKYKVSEKLDLTMAGRVDKFVALDATSFSPRAALVYKHSDNHTFRGTYNHSVGAPTGLNLFIDFKIQNGPAGSDVWLHGGADALTYDNGNAYSFLTQSAVSSTDVPLANLYALVAPAFNGTALAPAIAMVGANITGSTQATDFGAPLTRDPLELSSSDQFEIGYVGRMSDKLRVTVDAYYNKRDKNLTSTVRSSSFFGYATAGQELAAAITAVSPGVANIVLGSGLTVAQTFQGAIEGSTLNADTGAPNPLGFYTADQTPGNALDLSFFNLESIDYFGVDFGMDYAVSDNVSLATSVSWLSDTYWDAVRISGTEQEIPFSLNVPDFRAKMGIDYTPEQGFNANAAVRYRGEFQSVNGMAWTGTTEASTIFDLSVGYKFSDKYKLKFSASNVFDNEYRPIANAPFIGRTVLGLLTIDF